MAIPISDDTVKKREKITKTIVDGHFMAGKVHEHAQQVDTHIAL